jgi:putative ABC transport system permease protein
LVAEVSLSVILLIGASLLIVSLVRLQQVDPGFRPDHALTASVSLPPVRYRDPERITAFIRQVSENIAVLPGVQAAAGATSLPLSGVGWGKYFSIDGRSVPTSLAQVPLIEYRQITPEYFRAMGATLRRGRAFTPADVSEQPAVAIVNETLARRFWPNGDPIGARVSAAPPESLVTSLLPKDFPGFPRMTIVGIVEDLRHNGLERETSPEVYVPFAQARPPHEDASDSFFLVVRTSTDPLSYQRSIEAVVHQLDGNLPIANVRTLESSVSESLAQRRFATLLLSGLSGVALVIVIAGIYGVMAYVVSQRRHELGIRAALGATTRDLTSLVLSQGLRVTVVGTVIGLTFAASLSQCVSNQLFEVKAVDPAIYAGTALLMLIVAALACGMPALRAARLDPIAILRRD